MHVKYIEPTLLKILTENSGKKPQFITIKYTSGLNNMFQKYVAFNYTR